MRRVIVLVIAVVFIIGCGSQGTEKFAGVTEKHDYVSQGFQYLNQSDVTNAIKSFDLAIKQDPTNIENYLTLGQVYMRLNQPIKAIDTFAAATRVAPSSGEAYYMLATSKALDGRLDEAIVAAKLSAELFMAQKQEDMFKRSVALVQSLSVSLPGAEDMMGQAEEQATQ